MELDKLRILIADDDAITRRLIANMLKPEGCRVLSARDGSEAVDIACRDKPDIILMDVLMPVMDGYTALGEIKRDSITGGIPVVMLTAIDLPMNRKLAEGLGASGYLTKPFTRSDLLEAVSRFVPVGAGNNGKIGL